MKFARSNLVNAIVRAQYATRFTIELILIIKIKSGNALIKGDDQNIQTQRQIPDSEIEIEEEKCDGSHIVILYLK